jgi:hypothetical protein
MTHALWTSGASACLNDFLEFTRQTYVLVTTAHIQEETVPGDPLGATGTLGAAKCDRDMGPTG